MEVHYNWRTRFFSKNFGIFKQDMHIGELRKEGFSKKVNGELNSRRVIFDTKRFFKFETSIIDPESETIIGTVKYRKWKEKSIIQYNDKEYEWQFDNFIRSKWSISTRNGALIKYHSHGLKGSITSYTADEVLILTGFYIRNYLKQRTAAIAAAT